MEWWQRVNLFWWRVASDWRKGGSVWDTPNSWGNTCSWGTCCKLLQHENKRNCGMVVIHTTYIFASTYSVRFLHSSWRCPNFSLPTDPRKSDLPISTLFPKMGLSRGLSRQISTISRGLSDPMPPCSLLAEWGSLPPLILSKKVEAVHRLFLAYLWFTSDDVVANHSISTLPE